MTDLLHEIWGAVMRNKMRSVATGIAVASGIFLLIVLQGAGNGIINSLEENSKGFSFDAIHLWGGWTSRAYDGMKEGRLIQLDYRDEELVENGFRKQVNRVTSIVNQYGVVVSYGQEYLASVRLQGIRPIYLDMAAVKVLRGRALNQLDVEERRKVLLISDKHERELSASRGRSLLNEYVRIDGQNYRVVGIYQDDGMTSRGMMYVPLTTLQTLYNKGRNVHEVLMDGRGLDDKEKIDAFEEDLRRGLARLHSFHPEDHRAVWMWNEARSNEQLNNAKTILRTVLWVLGLLTMVSGVVGVSNIMLIAVKERTREFGIRKALGATPWHIIRMVVLESILITSLFGYLGMLAGVAFCAYLDATVANRTLDLGMQEMRYFVNPTVGLSTCLWATMVLVVSGAIAGFFPAHKASHVKPIEALHS